MITYTLSMGILLVIGSLYKQPLPNKHGRYVWLIANSIYLISRYIPQKKEISRDLRVLYHDKDISILSKHHLAIKISSSLMFAFLSVIIVTTFSSFSIIEILIIIGSPILGFLLPDWEITQKATKEQTLLLIDFAKFTYQLSLYVSCGLSLYQACKKCIDSKTDSQFYQAISSVISQTESGELFLIALCQLSSKFMSHEVTILVTLLQRSTMHGGTIKEELAKFSEILQQKRSLNAIKEGEKASVKMVFPLTLGLIGVLLILITPAILLISQL